MEPKKSVFQNKRKTEICNETKTIIEFQQLFSAQHYLSVYSSAFQLSYVLTLMANAIYCDSAEWISLLNRKNMNSNRKSGSWTYSPYSKVDTYVCGKVPIFELCPASAQQYNQCVGYFCFYVAHRHRLFIQNNISARKRKRERERDSRVHYLTFLR